ncbi:MAG: TerC/Alx family metal homeostasis membrane protein [Thaumarchaeota archaeon]|nr:TerC/Alx family metal homeostasis membrane protein [Nitrososphaerota archaeon]
MAVLEVEPLIWIAYHFVVIPLILVDLIAGIKRGHAITAKEAARWVVLWIAVGIAFGVFISLRFGSDVAALYFAAYTLEYTLSVDNLFVFAIIFMYFAVPPRAQPVVLYVGIISAIVMRATFIGVGLWLLQTFYWMEFIFGAVLLYSGVRLWRGGAEKAELKDNPIVRLAKKVLPLTDQYHGSKFVVKGSKLVFTPLILVLLAIESSDIMFAFDSVPAALAITNNFFLAYTSNVSAVVGLRSLYFLISITMFKFKYIGKGLSFILAFLGAKFFLSAVHIEIPIALSLAVVFGALAVAVGASILRLRLESSTAGSETH